MDIFTILILFRFSAVALGVGGSLTREFLIHLAIRDGKVDASEDRLIKGVDGLLRAVFSAFVVGTVCLLLIYRLNDGLSLFGGTAAFMELCMIAVLALASIGAEAEVFHYTVLSAVTCVSWCTIFFFELFGGAIDASFGIALLFYAIALSLGIFVFETFRRFGVLR